MRCLILDVLSPYFFLLKFAICYIDDYTRVIEVVSLKNKERGICMLTTKKRFNLVHFILGLVLFVTGVVSIFNPLSSLIAIVVVFAISAIFEGIIQLVFRSRLHEYTGYKAYSVLVLGILDILIGLFLLFNMTVGILALPYIFSVWFIIDSIGELIVSDIFKSINTGYYWFKIILNILGLVLGIMMLFNPIVSALTLSLLVGFYFLSSGIDFIVTSF